MRMRPQIGEKEDAALLRAVFDGLDEALCILDDAGVVRFMNRAAEALSGYGEEEQRGAPLALDPPIDQDAQIWSLGLEPRALGRRGGGAVEVMIDVRALGAAAEGRWLLRMRSRSEAAAHAAELKIILPQVFDTIPDGVILIDEHGAIRFFSAGAERLFGYGREEAVGQNVKLLMPPPESDSHDRFLSNYLHTGTRKIIGIGREVVARRKDGSLFPVYLSIGELWLHGERRFLGVAHDLTRGKRAAEKVLMMSAAMDQSPTAVLIADRHGVVEYVNDSFVKLTGYAAKELVNESPRALRSPHAAPEVYRRLWQVIGEGREWGGELECRRKDGGVYWALEVIKPLHDEKGAITHYLATQEDLTAQRRDREALAESEARFRQVAEMTGEWLWEQDASGRYTYSSAGVKVILGYAPEEIVGRNYRDLQIDFPERDESLATKARPFFRLVNHYRHKDGSSVFTESSGAPICGEGGKLLRWRGVDHDITAQKAFEDALRLRDRAIESVHVGIAISDARTHGNPNIYVNPELCRMTGYAREELLGHNLRMLRGPETDEATLDKIRRAVSTGEDCEATLRAYRRNGTAFWDEMLIAPVIDESGEIRNYVSIHTDVTERRRAAERNHELEIARQIQASLLPNAPLRTPGVEVAGFCAPAS